MTEITLHGQIERVAKALPVALAALYLAGFIIVASRLAGYGASSMDLFRIQYVAAGVWFALTCSLFFMLALVFRVFGEFILQFIQRVLNRRVLQRIEARELANAIVGDLLLVIVVVTLASITNKIGPGLVENFRQSPHLLWLSLSLAQIDVWIQVWLLCKSRQHEALPWSYILLYSVIFVVLSILISLKIFARDVYAEVPFPMGGGQTQQVVFWLGPQSSSSATAVFLERDGSGEYTVPYELLLENENSYIVISPKENQRSITFDRKAVGAMVVLGKRPGSAPANFQRNISEPSNHKSSRYRPVPTPAASSRRIPLTSR